MPRQNIMLNGLRVEILGIIVNSITSARKLRRCGVNLLGGRAAVRSMHRFMSAEMSEFDLSRALESDGAARNDGPESARHTRPICVEQEVKAEGLVRQTGSFARFLGVVSFAPGSVLTLPNVARDVAINRKTVEGFAEIVAIEVKNSDRVRPADVRGLKSFREDYPECKPLLLYRGKDQLEIDGITCWPVEHFLRELTPSSWPV